MAKLISLTDLKTFMLSARENHLVPIKKTSSTVEAKIITGRTLTGNKAKILSEQLVSLTNSPEVLKEVSVILGTPRVGETEEQFVARGKEVLRAVLKSKTISV
ncbi:MULTISPECIES: hypothetical protein [unclassified Pseudoalteromonas]|uniref:hypothetical protein n=1 Tax=unclassified Pseudoalteromonas TaxID=194690 RepID=UPI000C083FC6|nr:MULTISPECIES: hypothetical protein [unclassified Pseudoalteromonas]MDP2633522.1 hypothetical protein [Pseudoalteromonas sp. 1_MG-2023]PHN90457.1 hypothetical protein CSC79_07090 [Pseudoalteromonas sp. 3D05]